MDTRRGSVEGYGTEDPDRSESSSPFRGDEVGDLVEGRFPYQGDMHELSRRERERLVRRQLMLNAARAVFAEKGYAEATLDEIAHRAEFGKGTLYNYFEGGKEEILFAVFDDLYAALDALIAETFSSKSVRECAFRDVFEAFLTAIFSFFIERQDQFMIMMKEGHRMVFNEAPETATYFQEKSERVIEALMPAIEEGQNSGVLRDFPARSVAHMIMGNVKGYHMHMCVCECREQRPADGAASRSHQMPAPAESARFLTTFLLDGLLAGPED